MLINRGCGMVLPSTKFLIDNIIGKNNTALLEPLVLEVFGATLIQGVTSFSLTQLLSKEGQRLIAELRRKVQEHVGRLPVAYYDANKTGALVSRIMSDVEGVRNLIGTGLVDFVGGIVTALFALCYLLWISPLLTGLALLFIGVFGIRLEQGLSDASGRFSASAAKSTPKSGPAHRIAGRRARGEGLSRRSRGSAGLLRAACSACSITSCKSLTAISLMSLSATVLMGLVGATGDVCGRARRSSPTH